MPLYLRAAKYLEIDRRAEVLNKRLDSIKELFDMLATELNNTHANKYAAQRPFATDHGVNTQLLHRSHRRLEWIIIVLIMIEVFFQVVSLVLTIVELADDGHVTPGFV